MARRLPLHPGLGPVVVSRRPYTAPCTLTSTRGQRGGGGKQTWIHAHTGRRITSQQVEPPISDKLEDMKSAFRAADPGRTGLVSEEEFRRVLPPVFQNQLRTVINQVCEGSGETVDYQQFLRGFSRAPAACRASSSRCSVRRGAQNSPMSLSEIEKHLKEKIGANLRNMIRVFRLFDYNRGGHIQLHEFRRILDNYCVSLTDKEFQRLWNHHSPKNSSTISYELFLEKLGFGDSHNFRISPVCTKLEVCSREKTPPERIKQTNQRPLDPSVLTHRKLQTLFFNKMCVNSTSVWQALQAFDTTRSGVVTQEVLRAVLSSFIFLMNPHCYQKLTNCYGVKDTGLVRWKQFLGHFMKPVKRDEDTKVQTERVLEQPAQDEANLLFQDIYPQLKEIFHLLDQKEAGWITRTALQDFLDRPGGSKNLHPRLGLPQITELLSVLDPEHTGVIQKAKLERLKPDNTPASTVKTATPLLNPNTEETVDVPKETEDTNLELKLLVEKPTTHTADKVPVASASQRTVEDLLQEKLCERLGAVLEALKLRDPQLSGNVTQGDLKMVLSCCDTLLSDTRFNKPTTSPQSTLQSVRPPSDLRGVFQKMKSSLEERKCRLGERIQAVTQRSDEMLSERDVRKILEDSSVVLGDGDFSVFTDLLGSRHGRIERSSFLQKYAEFTDRHTQQSSEGHSERGEVDRHRLLTTAEQCLDAMTTRIKSIHGDYLTAFRLMDRKRKGVVDCQDFKDLYDSLRFLCRDREYEQLLDRKKRPASAGRLGTGSPAGSVERRLRGAMQSCWKEIQRSCREEDPQDEGLISAASFLRILQSLGISVTQEQFEHLAVKFDIMSNGCVSYHDFLRHFLLNLKPAETKTIRRRRLPLPTQTSQGVLSRPCVDAMLRIFDAVRSSWTSIRRCFLTSDRAHTGNVSMQDFRKVLRHFSVDLSAEEFFHLSSYFDADTTGKICYNNFLWTFLH